MTKISPMIFLKFLFFSAFFTHFILVTLHGSALWHNNCLLHIFHTVTFPALVQIQFKQIVWNFINIYFKRNVCRKSRLKLSWYPHFAKHSHQLPWATDTAILTWILQDLVKYIFYMQFCTWSNLYICQKLRRCSFPVNFIVEMPRSLSEFLGKTVTGKFN